MSYAVPESEGLAGDAVGFWVRRHGHERRAEGLVAAYGDDIAVRIYIHSVREIRLAESEQFPADHSNAGVCAADAAAGIVLAEETAAECDGDSCKGSWEAVEGGEYVEDDRRPDFSLQMVLICLDVAAAEGGSAAGDGDGVEHAVSVEHVVGSAWH